MVNKNVYLAVIGVLAFMLIIAFAYIAYIKGMV